MRLALRLLRCSTAAAVVELALLAPAILLLMLGTIEVSRMAWTRQTLDEVAYSSARCMAVSDSCATSNAQKSYAVDRAAGYGIAITDAAVTPAASVSCRGFPNSSRITIVTPMASALAGFLPALPTSITSQACFPQL